MKADFLRGLAIYFQQSEFSMTRSLTALANPSLSAADVLQRANIVAAEVRWTKAVAVARVIENSVRNYLPRRSRAA